MKGKAIKISPTGAYPCQWDDLIEPGRKVHATIYTLEEGKKDHRKPGITKGKDGLYDIVVHAKEITNEIVRNALKDFGKVTGQRYALKGFSSHEDELLAYAERLMRPLKNYGTSKQGYDFSRAKTPKQKAEVISIWIGEILYDALTYKDVATVKSLTETIRAEIEELIR